MLLFFRTQSRLFADTCGVHNLHGMPGVYGAICSAIACAAIPSRRYGERIFAEMFPRGTSQGGYQMAALGITLGIALGSGSFAGLLVKHLSRLSIFGGSLPELPTFLDESYWTVPEDYGPLQPAGHFARKQSSNEVMAVVDDGEDDDDDNSRSKVTKKKAASKPPKVKTDNMELTEMP